MGKFYAVHNEPRELLTHDPLSQKLSPAVSETMSPS